MRGIPVLAWTLLFSSVALAGSGPPSELTCTQIAGTSDVQMEWINEGAYAEINIYVDGVQIDSIVGSEESYLASGLDAGDHELCIQAQLATTGGLFDEVCCGVFVDGAGAIGSLSCAPSGASSATVTWTNGAAYTAIRVVIDSTLVAVLPGTATSYTAVGLVAGAHTICLIAETAAAVLPPVCCNVVIGIIGESPIDLLCFESAFAVGVNVSWTNMDTYSSIDIEVDGVVVATLPASATSYLVTGLAPGTHLICVNAFKNGNPLAPVCCDITTGDVDAPPSNLLCTALPGQNDVVLSWVNNGSYAEIQITLDGTIVDAIAGASTSYTLTGVPIGGHTVCVIAIDASGAEIVPALCCEVFIEELDLEFIDCAPIAGAVGTAVSWGSTGGFTSFEVYVDGALHATLPGSASFLVVLLTPGVHEVCVHGVVAGLPDAVLCCTVGDDAAMFMRGDCNTDGLFDISDAIYSLQWLIQGVGDPTCLSACDSNDDGSTDIADAIFSLGALFAGDAPPPPAPHPGCGCDPTPDGVGCAMSSASCP